MATLICVFGYVITIISILSNAQIVPVNENNQYPNTNAIEKVNGTNTVAYVTIASSTAAVGEKLSNDSNLMQFEDKRHSLAERDRQNQNQYEVQHKNEIQANEKQQIAKHQQQHHTHMQTAFPLTNEFMNETEKNHNHSNVHKNSANNDVNVINVMHTKPVIITTASTASTASDEQKSNNQKNIDFSMKMVRDNDNDDDTFDTDDSIEEITQQNLSIDDKSSSRTSQLRISTESNYFNENIDDGLKINLNDELSFDSIDDDKSSNINDAESSANIENDQFEELTLEDELPMRKNDEPRRQQIDFNTQNIYKVTKPNKSKQLKIMASVSTSATPRFQLAFNQTSMLGKQFYHPKMFEYITQLFDHYQWSASIFSNKIGPKCSHDMDIYLKALRHGRTWASKASDSSGRYRGQFLFGNDYWVGSIIFCQLQRDNDDVEMGFFIASVSFDSPEPMLKKHNIQLGQCLPQTCTINDVKVILSLDAAAIKFNEIQVNKNNGSDDIKNELKIIHVRRVPGEYSPWNDRTFYLLVIICFIFGGLLIIATIYECSLRSTKTIATTLSYKRNNNSNNNNNNGKNGLHIQNEHDDDSIKMEKIHANNILNGCNLELHQISMENMNESSVIVSEKNYTNNNNNNQNNNNNNSKKIMYQLNKNHGANNGNGNNNNDNHKNFKIRNNNTSSNNNHQQQQHHYNNAEMEKNEVKQLGIPQQLLLCFAFSTNAKRILSGEKLPQESISCIHGLRVFSLLWIIMVHTYLQTFGVSENRFSKSLTEQKFYYQIIGNASHSVDTFFYLSGLLVTYLFLRGNETKVKKTGFRDDSKQSLLLTLYRYLRLTPAYLMVILINTVALKFVYNLSVFPPGLPDHITCPNYWWRNILYIQTWFPFPELCMLWSWYLANDMQFYIWAIILLIFAKKHAKAAVSIIATFLVASCLITALVSLHFNYTHKVSAPLESFGYLYEKAWTRLGPYIMGMTAGYILNRFKSPPKIPSFINVILWIMSTCILLLLVFGVWNGSLSVAWTAVYVSLGHTAWGFALIWITLSCKWGLAKPIDNLLSYRALLPLSRLTYCAYLIHPVTQIALSYQLNGTIHIQHSLVLTIFLGNAVVSYGCAFILSLMFEAPVVRVLKILFEK